MSTDRSSNQAHDVARWHDARHFASTSHGDVAYHEIGEGPALLLIHGFPLNAYHWRDVMGALAGERRCIAPDLLGLGYSKPKAGADIGSVAQANMLAELLDALSIETADVISNDSGTAIAQLLAVPTRTGAVR